MACDDFGFLVILLWLKSDVVSRTIGAILLQILLSV